jgi:glycosyltransferase involved in cell wall biosynthesis
LQNIEIRFQSGRWLPSDRVKRPFVKHANPKASPGEFWHYLPDNIQPEISIIIPTFDAYRGGYFLKLLDQISRQNFSQFEVVVVRSDSRQGRAINIGAALTKGKYLLTLDDDTALPDPETFSKLVAVMEKYPGIGMAGGNNVIPEDASPFVRGVMKQIPRRSWKPVQKITDSDLAEHPCLIMRTAEFKEVGGENELIPRGLDPYLREEFRKLGKRVVVVPGIIYHHLPPDNLDKLWRQFYRNGRHAAYTNRNYPQWVIETPSKHGSFKTHKSFLLRLLRFPIRLLHSFLTGRFIWFLCEVAYALGFVYEFFSNKSNERQT